MDAKYYRHSIIQLNAVSCGLLYSGEMQEHDLLSIKSCLLVLLTYLALIRQCHVAYVFRSIVSRHLVAAMAVSIDLTVPRELLYYMQDPLT